MKCLIVALALVGCSNGSGTTDEGDTRAGDTGSGGDEAAGDATAGDETTGDETPRGDPHVAPTRSNVTLTTADSLSLSGYLTAGSQSPAGSPGVVLVHQFQQSDEQWGDLPQGLAERGYRVLAFDLRGHGESDAYGGTLTDILNDPDGAPRDVEAAQLFLAGAGAADPARIAIVGTSIGANLAVAAAINGQAKTYVAFSARLDPSENLAGATATTMTSVFYLAAQDDPGGQAADAQTMYDSTTDPRDIQVYAGSDHGIAILDNRPNARNRLYQWLDANL